MVSTTNNSSDLSPGKLLPRPFELGPIELVVNDIDGRNVLEGAFGEVFHEFDQVIERHGWVCTVCMYVCVYVCMYV